MHVALGRPCSAERPRGERQVLEIALHDGATGAGAYIAWNAAVIPTSAGIPGSGTGRLHELVGVVVTNPTYAIVPGRR